MKDYEDLYNEYRSKYYNACDQINACERQIAYLEETQKAQINRINELNTSIRGIDDAIDDMDAVLRREESITSKLENVTTKMDEASENFSRMVESSNVSNKNLNDVFGTETSNTKTAVTNVFETVRNRRQTLQTRLEEQKNELKQVKSDLSDTKTWLRQEKNDLGDWRAEKRRCYYNMEYYKRKMDEEAYY